MDTAEEASGKNVVPQVHKNYKGGDIVINAKKNITINPENSPQLARAYGHDIITASGDTLLGADDKTGIAIIMSVVQYLDQHPEMQHGTIKIAFTPDEETGAGIRKFDIPDFGADYAYTLDGGDIGTLTDETFNARKFTVVFTGNRAVHPGQAMNSPFTDNLIMASDFHTLLPRISRPETTSGRKGYIYVDVISTQENRTEINGIIRAFTDKEMEQLTTQLHQAFKTTKALYPRAQAEIDVQDEYKNMKSALPEKVVTLAKQAMKAEDIDPVSHAARGGTDGAVLSLAGLPTPDIFAGQFNMHSEREYADADVMEASLRTVLRLISLWDLQEITEK
jgi:tripeptide aminopeptidase